MASQNIVIISNYQISRNEESGCFFLTANGEMPLCPYCSGQMTVYDSRRRYVIRQATACKECYILRRLRCKSCKSIHTELPDFIQPFKHYDSQTIQDTIDKKQDNSCSADESTMSRWRTSFKDSQEAISTLLVAYYMRATGALASLFATGMDGIISKIRNTQPNWLSFVAGLLVNSGCKKHTKFAFCP